MAGPTTGNPAEGLLPLPDDIRTRSLSVFVVVNLLATTLSSVVQLREPVQQPLQSPRQVLANTSQGTPLPLRAVIVPLPSGIKNAAAILPTPQNRQTYADTSHGTPLALTPASVAQKPFFSWQHQSPVVSAYTPFYTSQETPKAYYQDVSFAPANLTESISALWRPMIGVDTSQGTPQTLNAQQPAPFVPVLFGSTVQTAWQPLDTSRGTFQFPVQGAPFLPVISPTIDRVSWQPLDTSKGTFPALFPAVQNPFIPTGHLVPQNVAYQGATNLANRLPLTTAPFANFVHQQPQRAADVADTSRGANLPALSFVQTPFPAVQHSAPLANVSQPLDTSKGTPLPLLTATVFAPFAMTDFPAPVESRTRWQQQWTFFGQNPDAIPPPLPPAPAADVSGGTYGLFNWADKPKKKKTLADEFVDEVAAVVAATESEAITTIRPPDTSYFPDLSIGALRKQRKLDKAMKAQADIDDDEDAAYLLL